ncbi:uncharacterized protein FOMMEDRAFT_17172 [Fomitiporia mediterranea MF3/22]|uniref:uncharacterized protein n=1 Tax=Fomitiporia mediterranea (strain MF3/22) TaxID=694068 RepID=UPI0004408AEF|nr:uncharacterized protein FOMMEDRAFT_17172 [Fomitiporia mediterranea MF3/22]EJD06690.1 hypothetical protein FOMMEDRAFT_17172 [Fomitiporia mediterranea MF3/22]
MADHGQDNMIGIDQIFKNATKSIEDAEAAMSRAKTSVEKAKVSKEGRNKVVAKASEIVKALLEPASQVSNLLNFLGNFYPPCGTAGTILQGIVDLEAERRDSDVRIGLVFVDMSTTLIVLGTLKPGFQQIQSLVAPLGQLLNRICDTMKSFGQFSEAFYEAKGLKSKLKHYIHAKDNKDKLTEFHDSLESHKKDLSLLLTTQTVLITSSNAASLTRIEGKINLVYGFFASLTDEKEDQAIDFVKSRGGEENVKNNDSLLDKFASKLGETITPNIRRTIKESAEEIFKQSYAAFNLKLQFAIEQHIEDSTEAILRELQSGPYELISDLDVKEIWKSTAAKESSVKRRQFIDAMVYYFNVQWKSYKVNNKANREDAWTKSIISKVHYHPAIGDAIDDDASGYISVEEVNEFLRKKPANWTIPQWIAYWAYGWDADNIFYQEKIEKSYKQLESLRDKQGPNAERIQRYLEETQKWVELISDSLYTMGDLDAAAETHMDKLRIEWRNLVENTIKTRLKSVNFKVEYTSMSAICGSERIEATFLPLVSLILSRHVHMLSQAKVTDEDVEESISTIQTLIEVAHDRIDDLRVIWRRQRTDVDVQIRYYSNGLFQDYFKANRMDFETDSEDEDLSEWDSEDEWGSEDDAEEQHEHAADGKAPVASTVQERSLPSQRENASPAAEVNVERNIESPSQRYRRDTQRGIKPSYAQSDDEEPNEHVALSVGGHDSENEQSVNRSSDVPPDSDVEQVHTDEEPGEQDVDDDQDEGEQGDDGGDDSDNQNDSDED